MLELTLIILLYIVTLYIIHRKFRRIIKVMAELDQILGLLDNDNNNQADEVDTPKEGVMQCKKREA